VLNERLRRRLASWLRGYPEAEWLKKHGLTLGRNVYIGRGTSFDTGFLWLISVGDDTTISAGVEVLAHDASTRFHTGYTVIRRVTIGSRVYIGAGSIILPGVTVGDDAIVGAGSVVRSDVEPGTVVAGNPARTITTTEDYVERHVNAMEVRPRYPREGWTVRGGIGQANKERMRAELADGPGYVE
jgi:maltose O-acetyltransferase